MKNEVLIILSAVVLILFSLPVKAATYCPGGYCAEYDPPGSQCREKELKPCIGSLYYGSGTGCTIGTSLCEGDWTGRDYWRGCSGWQNSYYESTESKCDFIDNDCDGYVDEGGVCDASEQCFNTVDDNSNSQVDCQDDKCLYSFLSNSLACVTLSETDVSKDFVIDIYDGAIVVAHYGETPNDVDWNESVDINKDSIINNKDFAWINANLYRSVPTDERLAGRCSNTPQDIYVGWVAPGNTSGRGSVNSPIGSSIGYKIDFFPKAGHNYTTKANIVNGNCCVRNNSVCTDYAQDERYTLYDVINNVYYPITYQQKLGVCGINIINKNQIQSAWGWQVTSYGQSDCSQLNCVSKGYGWQDVNAECSYLAADFNKGQLGGSFALVPANEAATWNANPIYIRNETFSISCISLDGGVTCDGGFQGLDKVILNRDPYRNQLQGNLIGIQQSCTQGNQASCDETAISSTTIVGTTTSSTTTISDFNGSSTIPSTTIGAGGGFGVCGDGVVNTGEQCEKPGDCIPLGMNDCDMTGLITGFECRCYSALDSGGTETILFTTSCQDVGNGQQGLRTETTRVIDVATGNVLSETSQQVTCSLPPVNVPGFSIINLLLVSSILFTYYLFKKK